MPGTKIRKAASLLAAALIAAFPAAAPGRAFAAEPPPAAAPSRAALIGLARAFVDSVDRGFERADQHLADRDPEEKRRQKYKVDIPDGEMLLLQIGVAATNDKGKRPRLRFNEPVMAIKQGDDVMISLSDFFRIAQFAIDVKPAEGVAEGWYIRQSQKFRLDAKALKASIRGEEASLSPDDVSVEETDILLRSGVLEKLFEFDSEVLLASQSLSIRTKQKWPAIEKLERLHRRDRQFLPPPELPRRETPYRAADVPNVDVATTRSFDRDADGAINQSMDYKVLAAGDLLWHTGRIAAAGSFKGSEKSVETAKATFERKSDKPDLLGWMGARRYEFGDIGGGVGMRASNRNPFETSGPTTVIEGDIPPGWDAELYRGSQYLGSITNSDGTYRFEDVELAGGANRFRVLKYGPLGEIEEEETTYFSTPRLTGIEGGLYEAGVSAAATDLWTRRPKESPDKYTPVVDGSYEMALSRNTSLRGSLSTSQQQDEQKTLLGLGVASYFRGAYLNAGLSHDAGNASWLASASARRSVMGHSLSLGASYTEDEYGAISGAKIPSQYQINASSRGHLPLVPVNYALRTSYAADEDGTSTRINRLSLGGRAGRLDVSTDVDQQITKTPEGHAKAMSGNTAVSGRAGRTNWRANANYTISPDGWSMNGYALDLRRGLAKDLTGALSVKYDPAQDFKSETASVTWNGKYMRVSPKIGYDDDRNFSAYLNTSFGLAYNPYNRNVVMRGKDMTTFGGIAAFVFLDKNGDSVFSEGDEPVQDAIVQALHSRSAATTDENGEAFLYDLPANVITDVRLDENSFFDPLLVPGFAGVSIVPRAGREARLEFPVHNGSEMDGTVYLRPPQGKDRSLRNVRVYLYDMDGKVAHAAATDFDGFYLFTKIRPGRYYFMIDGNDAKNFGLVQPLPQEVSFGYEGRVAAGQNVFLEQARKDGGAAVAVSIAPDIGDWLAANPAVGPQDFAGGALILNLGSYNSRLLMELTWFRLKRRYGGIVAGAELLAAPDKSNASAETGLNTLRARLPGHDIPDAFRRCKSLAARGFYCALEVWPQKPAQDSVVASATQDGTAGP